ncbi:hypothetical protein DICSQDRAFT_147680 [Dichomitus squalens LYAD-421 SS1]|uniref:Reverse transcriptase domain-containing protein n=1 Tax=Dichomitus squalens (strain LYAD-421) TaxID=732165 RepID=R7T0J1_DICSQ|nr:uncharacterized protein DICSQDRAFT_147680 [Dichomitus squalens LYAD-421 SS1]EJF60677.1 hypothetical protein DICSQDRAFT_147680 [Dichomitus squalens LYAD-421 SS1]
MIQKSDLTGFKVAGLEKPIKVTLFADNTTIYLSDEDDFDVLQKILDTWCSAAKAKFNILKTEIIPIGERSYREEMAKTYKETGRWRSYPKLVHMVGEGDAIRILGVFFGNDIDQLAIWSPSIAKVAAAIECWQKGNATLDGKRHVIQMAVAGMTQYLTDVQRMPDQVVKRLEKIIRDYLWDGKAVPPIAKEYPRLPIDDGGLNIIDISARNEAIDVMWLKMYLNFASDRPQWAYIADDILATNDQHIHSELGPKEEVGS